MASLTCLIVSQDSAFTTEVGRVLRSGKAPVSLVVDESSQGTSAPDLIVVDARASTPAAMSKIEQFRLSAPLAAIFAVALEAEPDLILQAMRAGANEFLTWPPSEDKVHEAVRRATGRLKAKPGTTSKAMIVAFVGAKGGAGTTTLAVNSGVEIARLSSRPTVIVDLQAGFGEVGLFLGIRSKYSILDALDNIHRLDREFLSELVVRHKSGLDVFAVSDQFDRPAASENAALEELLRFLGRR